MRFEATIPESRGLAASKVAEELGLSRSQLMDEALTLFLKAILEAKRGRRLVMIDAASSKLVCELSTPTLATLEWTQTPQPLALSAAAIQKMQAMVEAPPAPTARLRKAAKRRG